MTSESELIRHIGERLRARRRLAGVKTGTLAKVLGVTEPTILDYELGKLRMGIPALYRLARALRVSVDYFFDGLAPDAEPLSLDARRLGIAASFFSAAGGPELAYHFARIEDERDRRLIVEMARALARKSELGNSMAGRKRRRAA